MHIPRHPDVDIRRKLPVFTEAGLAFALALFVVLFLVSKEINKSIKIRDYIPDEIKVEEIERTIQEKTIPKPSRPTFTIAQEDEEVADMEDIDFADEDDWDIAPPPPPPMAGGDEEIIDFYAIEEQPELIGGTEALYKAVKYPEMAQRAGVEGLAQIRFIVGADGVPRDFEIAGERPEGLGFGDAAIEALRKMKFKPGKQRDKNVAVRMQQVIRFELTSR
ncbi:MAG: energy transducer TonB [bacterium]|jgi:protein TonB|nr:energy transducer TonB [bacterium]